VGKVTKHVALRAALAGAMLLAGNMPSAKAEGARPICIRSYDIDHTETPNDNVILFYMRGHKLFKADMINRCIGLRSNTRGFTYEPTNPGTDEICSNLLTIRLNDTGQVCLVGVITPVEPPAGTRTTP
jgi:hypothetical protein